MSSPLPNVQGLVYPDNFLDNLPVVAKSNDNPSIPIYSLTSTQFAALHTTHITSEVPDSVLFPFLHGLEGENQAQNSFFASPPPHGHVKDREPPLPAGVIGVPRYRGLVWVASEDEVESPSSPSPYSSDEDDEIYDFEEHYGHHSQPVVDSAETTSLVPLTTAVAEHRRHSTSSSTSSSNSDSAGSLGDSVSASYSTAATSPIDTDMEMQIDGCRFQTHSKDEKIQFTSYFHAADLLAQDDGNSRFLSPKVPEGISLRNFGIQVPIYATLSDIVVYAPSSSPNSTKQSLAVAQRFASAIHAKAEERRKKYEAAGVRVKYLPSVGEDMDVDDKPTAYLVRYNVFVLTDSVETIVNSVPWLLCRETGAVAPSRVHGGVNATATPVPQSALSSQLLNHVPDAIDFAQREREEIRELTKATPIIGDIVFLGNSNDVPVPKPRVRVRYPTRKSYGDHFGYGDYDDDDDEDEEDLFDSSDNPDAYDICIECRDYAPFPTPTQLRTAEHHLLGLDGVWEAKQAAAEAKPNKSGLNLRTKFVGAVRTSRPQRSLSPTSLSSQKNKQKPRPPPSASHVVHLAFPASPSSNTHTISASLLPFLTFLQSQINPDPSVPNSRKKRILIYSSDGYTESSVLALCLLMKDRHLSLPEAYLELQVGKGRSFFVYQTDLAVLRRVESRLSTQSNASGSVALSGWYGGQKWSSWACGPPGASYTTYSQGSGHGHSRAASNSISYASSSSFPNGGSTYPYPSTPPIHSANPGIVRRPRASTSPLLPPHADHQTWFNDPRFDGSFPSRVLPFLYLGNLNHASNAYMLHALGITHVVSVGECALVPPVSMSGVMGDENTTGYQYVAGKGPGGHGSLWIEEREGRIKVLDIKGVCDDGIDSLQPQLEPICNWIDKARAEGGKVLVHCRVGVSRSATVTIAYVMKHLNLPLVDAYLIVRSRRLSVLIQPNMRLLYNLCGWEVKLAKERAESTRASLTGADPTTESQSQTEDSSVDVASFRRELARSLNWPYLAREVHRLNEKYLS